MYIYPIKVSNTHNLYLYKFTYIYRYIHYIMQINIIISQSPWSVVSGHSWIPKAIDKSLDKTVGYLCITCAHLLVHVKPSLDYLKYLINVNTMWVVVTLSFWGNNNKKKVWESPVTDAMFFKYSLSTVSWINRCGHMDKENQLFMLAYTHTYMYTHIYTTYMSL
jgi:hypothetical protein